jgi:hypothetical protein
MRAQSALRHSQNEVYGFGSGQVLYVARVGFNTICDHGFNDYGAGKTSEAKHLTGQVQWIRDSRDVGDPELDEDMPYRLNTVPHFVASTNPEFHLPAGVGYAALAPERRDGRLGVEEIAVHKDLVRPRPESRGWLKHQHVVAALTKSMIRWYGEQSAEIWAASKEPSGIGVETMTALAFKRSGEDVLPFVGFIGKTATVNEQIDASGLRDLTPRTLY